MDEELPRVIVITGAMAAGKSSVAQALAERLPRAAHVRGDVFRRMIVSGTAPMMPDPTEEALAQLALRYELGCMVAERYAEAGFVAVYQDVMLGRHLGAAVERLARWRPGVVVLAPSLASLIERERGRAKTVYSDAWTPEFLAELVQEHTPRIGHWIDSSDMDVGGTVDAILADPAAMRRGLGA
ncbi:AAA family ATPase [Arenibaculum pallidiluteum]|uniref:AAA family ATPase n=1 Tax=Arenibaculum pallidiluteum TaxID=2812559 RepID=UPI001A96805E|nr:AAA family ATPase [Arenibaculum pallidiluteum]